MNQKRNERFASYTEPLREACRVVKPERILEWGPGPSTILMAEECPNAKILTIEHEEKYFRKWTEPFKRYPNIEMQHRVISMAGGKSTGYVTAGLTGKFGHGYDLIFVDGRFRQDCLKLSSMMIRDNGHGFYGIVVLHDAHRANYMPGVEYFRHTHRWPHLRTMAMSHSPIPDSVKAVNDSL